MGQAASIITNDPLKPTSQPIQLAGRLNQRTRNPVAANGPKHGTIRRDVIDNKRRRTMRRITLQCRANRIRPTHEIRSLSRRRHRFCGNTRT